MKPILFFLSALTAFCFNAAPTIAQEVSLSEQAFQFVYIAQDHSMNVQTLTEQLRDAYNHAIMDGPSIFYLSRGTTPLVVKVNFPDENRKDFEKEILPKLAEQNSSTVDGSSDKKQILKLLSENNFVDDSGNLIYRRTDFKFFVGQSFWTMGNNEAVIASLYFELDIANFILNETFNFNVYCPLNIDVDNNAPFGILNPDGINDATRLNKIF